MAGFHSALQFNHQNKKILDKQERHCGPYIAHLGINKG